MMAIIVILLLPYSDFGNIAGFLPPARNDSASVALASPDPIPPVSLDALRAAQSGGVTPFPSSGTPAPGQARASFPPSFVPPVVHVSNPPLPSGDIANPIKNPGFEGAGENGLPLGWSHNSEGSNDAVFTYPVSGHNGGSAAQITISSYITGEAQWDFASVPAQGGEAFSFSDFYMANTQSRIEVQLTSVSGEHNWLTIANLPPVPSWTEARGTFVVPAGTAALTVYQLIQSTGTLVTDDYSLARIPASFTRGMISINFDDGWQSSYDLAFPILKAANMPATFYIISGSLGHKNYMTASEVLALQAAGEEVGAHTRTHPDLRTVNTDRMQNEIAGSASDLRGIGIASVSTFAYPYGGYNSITDGIVQQSGYAAARTTDEGLNFPESNRYLLRGDVVRSNTTLADIEQWINEAVAEREWLIIVFHQIDEPSGGGDSYTASRDLFRGVVNYLADNHVLVVTNAQAIENMPQ